VRRLPYYFFKKIIPLFIIGEQASYSLSDLTGVEINTANYVKDVAAISSRNLFISKNFKDV